jgi:phi13 family phage major tail protein
MQMLIGLKNLHYAVLNEDTKASLKYDKVKEIPGTIAASINPSVSDDEVYADDQLWDTFSSLGKIEVEIEVVDLPLAVRAEILGNTIKDGVLIENKSDKPPFIALSFEAEKRDGTFQKLWLLKGKAKPISEDYATKKGSGDKKTPKMKLTFMPLVHNGDWKHTADQTVDNDYADWFDKVPGDMTVIG